MNLLKFRPIGDTFCHNVLYMVAYLIPSNIRFLEYGLKKLVCKQSIEWIVTK